MCLVLCRFNNVKLPCEIEIVEMVCHILHFQDLLYELRLSLYCVVSYEIGHFQSHLCGPL